jgi:hypothetical protein
MKGAKGETYFGIGFKSAGWSQKDDVGRFEGVFGRKKDATVVVSAFKVGSVRTSDGKVPTIMKK